MHSSGKFQIFCNVLAIKDNSRYDSIHLLKSSVRWKCTDIAGSLNKTQRSPFGPNMYATSGGRDDLRVILVKETTC